MLVFDTPYVAESTETIGNIAIFHSDNICNEKYCVPPVDRFFEPMKRKLLKECFYYRFVQIA